MAYITNFNFKALLVVLFLVCTPVYGDRGEVSRLIDLAKAVSQCECSIIYDGHYFDSKFASSVILWWIPRTYKNETAEEYVKKWAYRSRKGAFIWVQLKDGSYKPAYKILLEKLEPEREIIRRTKK